MDSSQDKEALILQKKEETSVSVLCEGAPEGFKQYMERVRALDVDDKPDYRSLRGLFGAVVKKEGLAWDREYDWTERACAQCET